MRNAVLLFVRSFLVVLWCVSCDHGVVQPHDPASTELVTTTIGGVVRDESGTPMVGIVVTAHGATAITNEYGVYLLKNVSVPRERVCVVAQTARFWGGGKAQLSSAQAEWPTPNGVTLVSLTIQQVDDKYLASTAEGGTINSSGAEIILPPNSIVRSSGLDYDGPARVAFTHISPDSTSAISLHMSGDAMGMRADNAPSVVTSYGLLRIRFVSLSGEELDLRPGVFATIKVPIPAKLAAPPRSDLPLWCFDRQLGMWREEGNVALEGRFYVGRVTRLMDWNVGLPATSRSYVEGTVRCGTNTPLAHVWLTIGQAMVRTDENGVFKSHVPSNSAFNIEVEASKNNGLAVAPMSVGPIAPDATRYVDVNVDGCPTLVTGTLINCTDQPIGGVLHVRTSRGVVVASSSKGSFQAVIPSDEKLTVTGFSTDAQKSDGNIVASVPNGSVFDLGPIRMCTKAQPTYIDIYAEGRSVHALAFTRSGASVAVVKDGVVEFYSTSTGVKIRSIMIERTDPNAAPGDRITFSDDDSMMLLSGSRFTRLFDLRSGSVVATYDSFEVGLLTADAKYIIAIDRLGQTRQLDARTGHIVKTFSLPANRWLRLMRLQEGGARFVVSGREPDGVTVWDCTSDSQVRFESTPVWYILPKGLSPDGTTLARLLSEANQKPDGLQFVDLLSGRITSTRTTISELPAAISWDNQRFITIDDAASDPYRNTPVVRDVRDGGILNVLPVPSVGMSSLGCTFDPSGIRVASYLQPYEMYHARIRIWTL